MSIKSPHFILDIITRSIALNTVHATQKVHYSNWFVIPPAALFEGDDLTRLTRTRCSHKVDKVVNMILLSMITPSRSVQNELRVRINVVLSSHWADGTVIGWSYMNH